MKKQIKTPFPYIPSLRKALLDGVEYKKADYKAEQEIDGAENLEGELLKRCESCHSSVKEIFNIMGTNGSMRLSTYELVELSEANRSHLRKRANFEGLRLSQCGSNRGQEYEELGRKYLGRCDGSREFNCYQEKAMRYVNEIAELLQIET